MAIADLQDQLDEVRIAALARRRDATSTTVIKAVRELQRADLATHVSYAPVRLTDAGRTLAIRIRSRRLIVRTLLLAAGVDPATATGDAEEIAYQASDETLAAFSRLAARIANT